MPEFITQIFLALAFGFGIYSVVKWFEQSNEESKKDRESREKQKAIKEIEKQEKKNHA